MPRIIFKPIFTKKPADVEKEAGQLIVSDAGLWVDIGDGERIDVLQSVRSAGLTLAEVEKAAVDAGLITTTNP
jgi:hypothetical protein